MRSRKDGSVFSSRRGPLKDLLGKTALALLISLILTGILIFAFVGPFNVRETGVQKNASPAATADGGKTLSNANFLRTANVATALRL